MANKLNFYSFIASLLCLGLFLSTSFSKVFSFFTNTIGVHPLIIVLILSAICFFLSMFGFSGVRDWKSFARSLIAVVITLGLSVSLVFIIGIGHLFGANKL